MLRRLLVGVLLAALCGCASARFDIPAFQADVAHGRFEAALGRLEDFGDDDVSALLDRALLLQALGRYRESNAAFERAETLIDDLYTRSLTKEALALLTSDLSREYRASGFERAYVAYFRAWNYLEQSDVEGALVEARRINERLNKLSQDCAGDDGACGHDPFLRYFSGLLFEWGGELNDAYVAYKQAHLAVPTAREEFGLGPPADLGERLVRLAGVLGFRDEEEEYAGAYGLDPRDVEARPASSVVVIVESGTVGARNSTGVVIPIYKGESDEIHRDIDGWSPRLAGRAHSPRRDVKLDFLLTIAIPQFVDRPPAARGASFRIGDEQGTTRLAAPLSLRARQEMDRAMGGILARTIARALTKYFAKKLAENEIGKGAGLLVNLLGAVTEQADTRSWRSLPYEIQVAAKGLPPGVYPGELRMLGSGGATVDRREYDAIRIPPRGGVAFVRHRTGI